MPLNLIIVIAALLVTWLVFSWLVKVVKMSVKTALLVVLILLILQLGFGVSSQQLWQEIINLPQTIQDLFNQSS